MSPNEALHRGWTVLRRYPWLLLLPLLWDLSTIGLAALGLPSLSFWPVPTLWAPPGGATQSFSLNAFLPSAFPSITDLKFVLHPARQPTLAQAPPWLALLLVLGVPLLGALFKALFFGALAEVLLRDTPRPRLAWVRARRALPAFYVLDLLAWLAQVLLPMPVLLATGVLFWLIFALHPFTIGILGMPLHRALPEAVRLLWGNFGAWVSLGWRCLLYTLGFSVPLVFTMGAAPWFALAFYPALATALVAAAAAFALGLQEQPTALPAGSPSTVAALLTVLLTMGAAAAGGRQLYDWSAWQPTREAALASASAGPVVYVSPQPAGDIVLYRNSENRLGAALLARSRWGWHFLESVSSSAAEGQPVLFQVYYPTGQSPSDSARPYVTGEIYDSRVAFIALGDERYPVGADGPYFVVALPNNRFVGPIQPLDAAGSPVPAREVKR